MKKALGLVEIEGLSSAVLVADTMVKAANITLEEIENTKGLGWMTIKITGDVGAVTAAVNAGKQVGIMHGHFVTAKIIPRPSDFIESFFCPPSKDKEKLETPKKEQTKEKKEEAKKSRKKTKKLVIKEKQSAKKQSIEEKELQKEEKNIELEDNNLEKEILQEQSTLETEKEQKEVFEQFNESSENQNFEQEPSDSENND